MFVLALNLSSDEALLGFEELSDLGEEHGRFHGLFDEGLDGHEVVADIGVGEAEGHVAALIHCAQEEHRNISDLLVLLQLPRRREASLGVVVYEKRMMMSGLTFMTPSTMSSVSPLTDT